MEYNDSKINETIYFVKNLEMPFVGRDAITKLNIIKRVFNVESNKNPLTLEKLKDEHRELFTGSGELQGTYSIKLKPECEPFSISTELEYDRSMASCVFLD